MFLWICLVGVGRTCLIMNGISVFTSASARSPLPFPPRSTISCSLSSLLRIEATTSKTINGRPKTMTTTTKMKKKRDSIACERGAEGKTFPFDLTQYFDVLILQYIMIADVLYFVRMSFLPLMSGCSFLFFLYVVLLSVVIFFPTTYQSPELRIESQRCALARPTLRARILCLVFFFFSVIIMCVCVCVLLASPPPENVFTNNEWCHVAIH